MTSIVTPEQKYMRKLRNHAWIACYWNSQGKRTSFSRVKKYSKTLNLQFQVVHRDEHGLLFKIRSCDMDIFQGRYSECVSFIDGYYAHMDIAFRVDGK